MNSSDRDPHRESRRAGERSASNSSSGGDSSRYVLGSDGHPLRDRYGRPVMRRDAGSRSQRPASQGRASQAPSPGSFRAVNPRNPEPTRFDIGPQVQASRNKRAAGAAGAARAAGAAGAGAAQSRPRQQMPPTHGGPGGPGGSAQGATVQRQFQGAGQVGSPGRRGTGSANGPGTRPRRGGARRKRGNPVKRFFGCAGWNVIALIISLLLFVFWTDSRLSRTAARP